MDSSLNDSQILSSIKDYTEQLKQEPESHVFYPLAQSYIKLGLTDSARNVLRQGLLLQPDHLDGQLLLAELLGENGHYDDAVALYDRVLNQHPESFEALIGIARLDLRQSNITRARSYIERARSVDPQSAVLNDLTKQLSDSTDHRSQPVTPFATTTIAELYVKQGLIEKAINVYHTLVTQQPDNDVIAARLNELMTQSVEKSTDDSTSVEAKLESWISSIQRRRKNV
jgi:tetratricopeptide (TPR) repeat protein